MATVFDTLAFTRKLTEAGMERGQSEAIASAVHEAVRGSVATQHDVEAASHRLDFKMDAASHTLDLKIEAVRADVLLLKWMTGAIVAGVVALISKAFF